MTKILNIAFYKFASLAEYLPERYPLRDFCTGLGLKGTVLLSLEGINGNISGEENNVRAFQEKIRSWRGLENLECKESWSEHQPHVRMLVKLKKEIISMGRPDVRPDLETGKRLRAHELKTWLDDKRDFVLLDTRNDYEIELGAFPAALDLKVDQFRKFPEIFSEAVKAGKVKNDRPLVMYCTGGIRCEKATAFALKNGFSDVYQLEGGILKYFEEVGGDHYEGDCFVFDHREALHPDLRASKELVGKPARRAEKKDRPPNLPDNPEGNPDPLPN